MYWEKSDSNSVQSYLKIYALFILSMPFYKQFVLAQPDSDGWS